MSTIKILTLVLLCSSLNVFAQKSKKKEKEELPARYIITESTLNNKDLTWFDTEREGYFIFIELDNQLNLCNMSANNDDYSFGTILDIKSEKTEETDDTYESATYKFRWKYYNTYDDETGYANINFEKIYKPQGTIFKLTMILPNLDVYIYKGYMEGTLDFDKLK